MRPLIRGILITVIAFIGWIPVSTYWGIATGLGGDPGEFFLALISVFFQGIRRSNTIACQHVYPLVGAETLPSPDPAGSRQPARHHGENNPEERGVPARPDQIIRIPLSQGHTGTVTLRHSINVAFTARERPGNGWTVTAIAAEVITGTISGAPDFPP